MDLSGIIKSKDTSKLTNQLQNFVKEPNAFQLKKIDVFEELLGYDNVHVQQLTVQLLAELAKSEENRKVLTEDPVVEKLKLILKSNNEEELLWQTLRALGNLCFDNEEARNLINKDGLKYLLNVIDKYSSNDDECSKKIVATSCGFLYNLLMNCDDLQKASLAFNILDLVEKLFVKNLSNFDKFESSFLHLLYVLSSITEFMIDEWLSKSLIGLLVQILRKSENPEISALCLELLRMQSENNDVKLYLAKEGTCELVYDLVEKYGNHVDDEESRALLKVACDLIVVILTGDESMDFLYENGKGAVYRNMVSWLSSKDPDLLSTGVLAIGNFARNDLHCKQIVESGLAKVLLSILSQNTSDDANVLIQHALLSALRNLSIPVQNKKVLIDENLVDILYKMLSSEQSPVVFKLLGTFRMIVDGQEETALNLIQRKEFVEKLVYWCYNSDHFGVRGEVPRLLSWLIKNCHSSKPFSALLSTPDSLKCLIEMISSMHAVMQNEALLALNIVCLSYTNNETDLPKSFVSADIGKHLHFIITKYHEKMENGTAENLLMLIEQLTKYALLNAHFRESKVDDALKLFAKSANNGTHSKRIEKLVEKIEK